VFNTTVNNSNTNNTDHHSITQLLLTVVLNTNNTDHHSITQLLLTPITYQQEFSNKFVFPFTTVNNRSVLLWRSVLLVVNTTVANMSAMTWWSVLLMFNATVNNSSVIMWWSVLLVFDATEKQSTGRHVAPLGHIILIPCQPVFALTP
jgi:hypothetical protein